MRWLGLFLMDKDKKQFRDELLVVMWRWAKESDLTMGEWLQACHEAIERIITPPPPPKS